MASELLLLTRFVAHDLDVSVKYPYFCTHQYRSGFAGPTRLRLLQTCMSEKQFFIQSNLGRPIPDPTNARNDMSFTFIVVETCGCYDDGATRGPVHFIVDLNSVVPCQSMIC